MSVLEIILIVYTFPATLWTALCILFLGMSALDNTPHDKFRKEQDETVNKAMRKWMLRALIWPLLSS
jgi:hypothetical protein